MLRVTAYILSFLVLSVGSPLITAANTVPATYTNDNFLTTVHDQPVSFTYDQTTGFQGITQTGKQFSQVPVITDPYVKLHRFSIDAAWFYISNRGVIYAPDDTTALSIYLSRSAAV